MAKRTTDYRSRLTQAALKVVYRQGFGNTAIADIAREAKVPLGNVYYYFKTKDRIGEAIVGQRLAEFRALRQEWERSESPKKRLLGYVQMTLDSREAVARGGCPIGTFCSELSKGSGPLAKKAAAVFAEALAWIEVQFHALGRADARDLAVHFLSTLQGASVLAHAFHDPEVLAKQAGRLRDWIQAM